MCCENSAQGPGEVGGPNCIDGSDLKEFAVGFNEKMFAAFVIDI
jgi:hypothetical protein